MVPDDAPTAAGNGATPVRHAPQPACGRAPETAASEGRSGLTAGSAAARFAHSPRLTAAARLAHSPRVTAAARIIAVLAILAGITGLGATGYSRIERFDPDFEYFYKAGAWLLDHGGLDQGYDLLPGGRIQERDTLKWYLPFASRMMTLIAWLPPRTAGYVWLALNLAATLATMVLLGRSVSGLPPRDWPITQLLPFFLAYVYWYWEYRLNQINNFTLLLIVAALVLWQVRRHVAAGMALGAAILLKVTPALLLVWFLLKRQYRTAGAALLTIVLAGPLADAVVFGPSQAASQYREWFRNAVASGSPRGLILSQSEMDWRNQALGATLARWLHPTNYSLRFDNDPRFTLTHPPHTLNIADLPLEWIAAATTIACIGIVALLVWIARRPAVELSPWQLRAEWALFTLAMLWLMPVMRRYHVIWVLPALAVLAGMIDHAGPTTRRSIFALLTIAGFAAAQLALFSRAAEASGLVLLSTGGLAAALLVMRNAPPAPTRAVKRGFPIAVAAPPPLAPHGAESAAPHPGQSASERHA
jgi:hypothetical protein